MVERHLGTKIPYANEDIREHQRPWVRSVMENLKKTTIKTEK